MTDVTVLTAAIPQRLGLLAENLASVAAQTHRPVAHLVGIDHERRGAAVTYNALLAGVDTEWVTFLDDDDVCDPGHLATMVAASDDADVVYTFCRCVPVDHYRAYNADFDAEQLQHRSVVPITAMVRTSYARKVEGFPADSAYDWRFWQALHAAGARFVSVPLVTWSYRLQPESQSHGTLR